MIQRYEFSLGDGGFWIENANGDWVKAEDAAKLEADCKRYREALREIADEARRVLIETPKDKDPMMMAPWVAGRAYEALREAEDYPTKED